MSENGAANEIELVPLTEEQSKARRSRNVAIALCLVAMVGVFFAATVTRFVANPQGEATVKAETN